MSLIGVVGRNGELQCGVSSGAHSVKQMITTFFPFSIRQIDCGYTFTTILTKDGQVFASGAETKGQTGVTPVSQQIAIDDQQASNNNSERHHHKFQRVRSLIENKKIEWISCGALRSFFVSDQGKSVYGVGSNTYYQLGLTEPTDYRDVQLLPPFRLSDSVDDDLSVTHIACSYSFTTFVCNNKYVFVSGQNWLNSNRLSASRVLLPFNDLMHGEYIVRLSAGSFHCMLLTNMGRVFSGGENSSKLAQPSNCGTFDGFRLVTALGEKRAKLVRCKCDASVIVTCDNEVYLFIISTKKKKYCDEVNIDGFSGVYRFILPNNRPLPPVIDVVMGRDSIHVVTREEIFSGGTNEDGELNLSSSGLNEADLIDGSVARSSFGCPITPNSSQRLAIACGEHHTIVFTLNDTSADSILFLKKLTMARQLKRWTDIDFVFA